MFKLNSLYIGDWLILYESNRLIEMLTSVATWPQQAPPDTCVETLFAVPLEQQPKKKTQIALENPSDFVALRGTPQACEMLIFGYPSERLISAAFARRPSNLCDVRPIREGEAVPGLLVDVVA